MAKLDFIGIGAQRSGTTWLYNTLKLHPQISFGLQKEIDFFNDTHCFYNEHLMPKNFLKGIDWYLHQLALEEGKVNGEISPNYLSDEKAPSRIKHFFPHVKLLVILRNPIERAYSQYRFFCSGSEKHSFFNFDNDVRKYPEFRERGLYFKYLSRYYKLFPPEQIGVFLYDDLKCNPEKFLCNVENFLGVKEFIPPNIYERVNQPRIPYPLLVEMTISQFRKLKCFPGFRRLWDSRIFFKYRDIFNRYIGDKREVLQIQPMNEETIQYLKDFFSEDIQKLERLIKKDLSMWLKY